MKKSKVVFILAFLIFFSSLYTNIWRVATNYEYSGFDFYSEALILGKISLSEKNGIFSNSGFCGVNYDKSAFSDEINEKNSIDENSRTAIVANSDQRQYYFDQKELPNGYCPYLSQIGGAGYFYSVINKILPFSNTINYHILRFINVLLITIAFFIFILWVQRNFGFMPALVTFILLFLSSWIVLYSGRGLWWSLWNFYLPFLTMLITLEKRNINKKKTTEKTIFISLFLAVFTKCFFTGFEFITVSLVSAFCPIVYYFWVEKAKFSSFIYFSFKVGIVSFLAVSFYMLILILQLYSWFGNLDEGIQYIFFSFDKRTSLSIDNNTHFGFIVTHIIKTYLEGNVFKWGFIASGFEFHFKYMCYLIMTSFVIIYAITRKINNRKYIALILATAFSILCPVSWFIIFKDHSYHHPHLDYIIWYIPFLPMGFAIIGISLSLIVSKIRSKAIS